MADQDSPDAPRAVSTRWVLGPALIVVVLALMALAIKLGLPRTLGIEREPAEQPAADQRAEH